MIPKYKIGDIVGMRDKSGVLYIGEVITIIVSIEKDKTEIKYRLNGNTVCQWALENDVSQYKIVE